jgi:hypothetical protein
VTVAALNSIAAASVAAVCGVSVAAVAAVDGQPWPAGGGGSSEWWALADMANPTSSVELTEVEFYVGATKQTVTAFSIQGSSLATMTESTLRDNSATTGNFSASDSQHDGAALVAQLSATATIDGIKLGSSTTAARVPYSLGVYKSTDSGATWELYGVVRVPVPSANAMTSTLTIDLIDGTDTGSHRYWRAYGIRMPDATDGCETSEFQLYEGASRRDSGATWSASGFTMTSASNLNDNSGSTKPAFDTVANIMDDASYLAIDLGAAYAIDGVRIAPDNRTYRVFFGMFLYGSDDNVTFKPWAVVRNQVYPHHNTLGPILPAIRRSAMAFADCKWSTTDKSSGVTVSTTDLAATIAQKGSSAGQVRATVGKSSGVWYWECGRWATTAGGNVAFGIRKSTEAIGTAYNSGDTIVVNSDAAITVGSTGASAGTGATFARGDIVRLKFDATNGTLHGWVNGTAMNGGSAIVTGIPAGTWYPFAGLQADLSNDISAYIFTGAGQQLYDIPAGASPIG